MHNYITYGCGAVDVGRLHKANGPWSEAYLMVASV